MKVVFIAIWLLAFAGIVIGQTDNLDTDERRTWQQREEESNLQREYDEKMKQKREIEKEMYKRKQQEIWEDNFSSRIKESLEEKAPPNSD